MEAKEMMTGNNVAPVAMLAQARLNRISRICFNLAIALFIAIFAMLLSSILGPILYICVVVLLLLVMGCMLVFTVGAVVVIPGNPLGKVWALFQTITGANDSIMWLTAQMFNATKWVALVGVAVSLLSITLISVSKKQPKVGKIILLSLAILVMLIVFAFQVLTGGVQW